MSAQGRKHQDDAGFSLLEALIAMALTGMLLVGFAAITAQWLPNWNAGLTRVQGDEAVALGLQRLTDDLAAAEFVSSSTDSALPVFEGGNSSVTFVRTALAPNAPPGLEIVRIAEVAGRPGLDLVRTQAPFAPTGPSGAKQLRFADPVVLLHSSYVVSFSYAGTDRVWNDAWHDEIQLPTAVKVTLRDGATRRALAASSATLVHASIPVKCLSAKSREDCVAMLKHVNQASAGAAGSASGPTQ